MVNILVFLVMFCFSCSISFADTEKSDAEKEKRYQEYKRKQDEKDEFDARIKKRKDEQVSQEFRLESLKYKEEMEKKVEVDSEARTERMKRIEKWKKEGSPTTGKKNCERGFFNCYYE